MIVNDFHIFGACGGPAEADAELVIHADAVLPGAIALEQLQPIPGRYPKITQATGNFQLPKLAPRDRFDTGESSHTLTRRQSFRIGAAE